MKLKTIVFTLASDSMQGRAAGTIGEDKANRFIEKYFKVIGLQPIKESFLHSFVFPQDSTRNDTAKNICGIIDNKAAQTIIIGAHYDHLGMGGLKSKSLTNKKIHNGADDNASGIAIMLLLAEQLKKSGNTKFNYLLVAFSAHEDGLFGSEAFVAENIADLSRIKLMLNFDMLGRLDKAESTLLAKKNPADFHLDSLLTSLNYKKFQVRIQDGSLMKSDASAFSKKNISTLTFSTGLHDDYHKVTDTAEKINYEGMDLILEYLKTFLLKIN